MSTAIEDCCGPESPCEKLARQIDELINRDKRLHDNKGTHGLKHRFPEQINGANGPGTASWDEHDKKIKEAQKRLRNLLEEFERNDCGDKVPTPQGAWSWVTRPAPQPSEWLGPPVQAQEEAHSSFWEYMEKATGLTGAALLIYIIISEGSRLFPLRNAVPVP